VLAIGDSEGCVQLWDVANTKCMRTMSGHTDRVSTLDWNMHILARYRTSGAGYGTSCNRFRLEAGRIPLFTNLFQQIVGINHNKKNFIFYTFVINGYRTVLMLVFGMGNRENMFAGSHLYRSCERFRILLSPQFQCGGQRQMKYLFTVWFRSRLGNYSIA
jgi:hypothetical protein